jgi:hypothetical protein
MTPHLHMHHTKVYMSSSCVQTRMFSCSKDGMQSSRGQRADTQRQMFATPACLSQQASHFQDVGR